MTRSQWEPSKYVFASFWFDINEEFGIPQNSLETITHSKPNDNKFLDMRIITSRRNRMTHLVSENGVALY